jgi:DNA replication protein DnaC
MQTANGFCEIHGEYQIIEFSFMGGPKTPNTCTKCFSEENDKQYKDDLLAAAKQERLTRIANIGFPKRFVNAEFENYIVNCGETQQAVFDKCQAYANSFDKMLEKGAGLIFRGLMGNGKTHLAVAIAKQVCRSRKTVIYRDVFTLIREIRSTWVDGGEELLITKFQSADLLIIDEVGIQAGTDNERNILFEIINGRYGEVKPTILISNLGANEISEFTGKRSTDRITDGGGGELVFNWESARNTHLSKGVL